MPQVLVAFGSNLGDRLGAIQSALRVLAETIRWQKASLVYETAPMYVEDQPPYLNAAALGTTVLGPLALLDALKAAEARIGREKGSRYGPRLIDIDLVGYGRLQLKSHRPHRSLLLPHHRTPGRRFVLSPLADLDPDLELPGLGAVGELLRATNSQAGDVKILNDAVLSVCRE